MKTSQAPALIRRLVRWSAASSLVAACLALLAPNVAAQSSRSSGSGRDFVVALPLALNGESVAKVEMNVRGSISLGIEIQSKRQREELDEKESLETKESMVSSARGAAIILSRYSEPTRMAGFYWTLGLGYRQMETNWRVRPDQNDKAIDMSLVDELNTLHHRATLSGATGHMRVGYRYVAAEMPLMIGAYFGLRHFQSDITEKVTAKGAVDQGPVYAEMTDDERGRLQRRYMTWPEPAIEFGFVF